MGRFFSELKHHKLIRVAIAYLVVAGVLVAIWTPHMAVAQDPPTVLITGSSRGMGLELTKQYAAKGWKVIATCRTPGTADALNELAEEYSSIAVEELDVTDHAEIEALAKKYADVPIDVLINNAGIFGPAAMQTLEGLDYKTFTDVMAVNVYGPLNMSQAFTDNVAASEQKKIVTITSGLGSMALTDKNGGYYFYRISKAGANIVGRTLAADLRDRGILIGLFNPGIVDTEFGRDTDYNGTRLKPGIAVGALIGFIEELNAKNAATMINYDGTPMPW
jgi:NAD(P)-dependent dehydrogenase (short-subunit alcohol dehydrogenase family)